MRRLLHINNTATKEALRIFLVKHLLHTWL